MPLKLRTRAGAWPPGGFPFKDPRTGKTFDAMSADLALQAKNVIAHRSANPRIYPRDEAQYFFADAVKQEIVDQICANRPELCTDHVGGRIEPQPIPKGVTVPSVQAGKRCYKCGGTEFDPIFCKTCSGSKVKAWLCRGCRTPNPK